MATRRGWAFFGGGRIAAVVLAVALAAVAGGCSSSGSGGITPLGSDTTNPTASNSSTAPGTTTTTTVDATRGAIVAAYRQDENVYLAVAGHYPVVPTDPRLPQVMTGNELKTVRSHPTAAALQGQYAAGTVELARW